jgi:hypothetical protein
MNLNGKVQLVFVDIPRNLPIPLISKNPNDIHAWNRKVDEYMLDFLILPKCFWLLMGLSSYFTWITLEFGGQVLSTELWLLDMDEVGCGELIAIYK